MPTYVYRFVDTGETIEVQQSFSDAALTEATHPGTGEVLPVKKVFTPVGVTFKGGGFYKTDSRGKSSTSSRSSSGSDTSSAEPQRGVPNVMVPRLRGLTMRPERPRVQKSVRGMGAGRSGAAAVPALPTFLPRKGPGGPLAGSYTNRRFCYTKWAFLASGVYKMG